MTKARPKKIQVSLQVSGTVSLGVPSLGISSSRRLQEIWIGDDVISRLRELRLFPKEKSGKAFIIGDRKLKKQSQIISSEIEKMGWKVEVLLVRATENLKTFRSIYPLYGKFLDAKLDRDSVIFALGGGVIGDAVGFLAGTYLRGIRWVGIPTTLLAQVDSSVGGKTGINHEKGKNLIGVFHHPSYVICDTSFLKSLPTRDLISGLGEMIKYGLTFDPKLFKDLKRISSQNGKPILDPVALTNMIHRCLKWKTEMVVKDERDTQGVREVLNFGHTFAHALEAECGYGFYRHGEAVILGMRAAVYLSGLRGLLKTGVQQDIDSFLETLPVPAIPQRIKIESILGRLKWDKKSKHGRVRFVLLKGVGKSTLDHDVSDSQVRDVASWLLSAKIKFQSVTSR